MATVTSHEQAAPQLTTVDLAHRLRTCRQYRGWTQEQLAARSGVRPNAISQIETGARPGLRMEVETLWRLAWALGTSMDALVGIPVMRGEPYAE